jgi:hypothetical protein
LKHAERGNLNLLLKLIHQLGCIVAGNVNSYLLS